MACGWCVLARAAQAKAKAAQANVSTGSTNVPKTKKQNTTFSFWNIPTTVVNLSKPLKLFK